MSTEKQILRRAADLVAQGWTQGWYATDANGNAFAPDHPNACKFCAIGAIKNAAAEQGSGYLPDILHHFSKHEGIHDIAEWNDDPSRTQGQVVAALRNAAK